MEEKIGIEELEQMRAELDGFRSQLRQQKIFNEKMMRRAMRKDYSKERKSRWKVVVIGVVAIPLIIFLAAVTGVFPVWFLLMTGVFLLASVGITVYRTRRYVSDDVMNGDVLTVARNMADCKRFDNHTLAFFSIPVVVVWCAAFFWLILRSGGEMARAMAIGGAIGGIIGAVLGVFYCRDSKKRINGIIAQIEEMKEC